MNRMVGGILLSWKAKDLKRGLSKKALILRLFIIAFVFCYSVYFYSMRFLKINYEKIKTKKFAAQTDSIKILHISDLHSNSPNKKNSTVFKAIEKLEFDMAVLTGDLVMHYAEELTPYLEDIKALAERVPVFFVDGNHESYVYEEISELLRDAGVTVLNNNRMEAVVKGVTIDIVGIKDTFYPKRDALKINELFTEQNDRFLLVLVHRPEIFDIIKAFQPDLVLSGHTHGGQIRLPFFPTLFAPGQGLFPKYGDGFYSYNDSKLYISRGIGATIFPIRFFNRAEIAIHTISKE